MKQSAKGRRTGLLNQDKPRTGKKGARGQAEGIRSKRGTKVKVPDTPKKPGRQKQTAKAIAAEKKRAKSDRQ